MSLSAAGSVRDERGEVGHVVRHDRTPVLTGALEHVLVRGSAIAEGKLGRCDHVHAARAQLPSDLRRPHLVQQQLHPWAVSSCTPCQSDVVKAARRWAKTIDDAARAAAEGALDPRLA